MEAIDKMTNRVYLARLSEKREVSKNTFELRFQIDEKFNFKPGQYVWVEMHGLKYEDEKGSRRAFSITSAPNDRNEISILLRGSGSGFKRTLLELDRGAPLNIIGPFGSSFIAPGDESIPLVYVVGGVGVAAALSQLRSAAELEKRRQISVLYYEESNERAAFVDEINGLSQVSSTWKGEVIFHLVASGDFERIQNLKNSLIYISGTQGFVDAVHKILFENGIRPEQMVFENFYPSTDSTRLIRSLFGFEGAPASHTADIQCLGFEKKDILLLAVESSTHHTIITDINGVIVYVNRAAEKITGFSRSEMIGQTARIWGGLMSKEFYQNLWKSKQSGEAINEEIINRRKDGSLYYVLSHIAPMRDPDGMLIGYIGTEEDITAIKKSEIAASTNALRLELATQSANIGIWELDLENSTLTWYHQVDFLRGVSPANFDHHFDTWKNMIHVDDRKKFDEVIHQALLDRKDFNLVFRVIPPDGALHYLKLFARVKESEGGRLPKMVGVSFDITHEEEVGRAKSEFVSLASHQLKTPVGAVRWAIEMLLSGDYGELTPKQKEVLTGVYDMDIRMNDLVTDFLNISRIELGTLVVDPVLTDFKEVSELVLKELEQKIIEKGHTLTRSYQSDLERKLADPKLLQIIFLNLLTNAIKYTPHGGKIGVSIGTNNEHVEISVSNNGKPIPQNEQSKIFTKLYRATGSVEQDPNGNGLGLYLLKSVVETAGGRVWFESAEGRDTTFYVQFPSSGMQGNKVKAPVK